MPRYTGKVLYRYRYNYNGREKTDYTAIRIDITCHYNQLQSQINELVREQRQILEEDYNRDIIDGAPVRQEIYNDRTRKQRNIRFIRMRDSSAPHIDGFPAQPWDTKQGTCVIDYLFHRYQIKRKIPTKEHLINILQENDEEDIITNGVSTHNIENFARYIKIPIYVLNDFDEIEHYYDPPNSSTKHYPTLVYRISNNHFYPIEDPNKKKHFIMKILKNQKNPCNLLEGTINQQHEYTYIENPKEQIINNFKNNNILPNKVFMTDNEITGFSLNDTSYKYQQFYKEIQDMNKKFNLSSTTLTTAILDLLKKTLSQLNPISTHNSDILNQLIKAKENRIHHGYIDGYHHISPPDETTLCAWDINKCYRSVLYNPTEKWITLEWTDDFKPYTSSNKTLCLTSRSVLRTPRRAYDRRSLPLGLYYVETNDNTLFKGNNIYSSSILNYAKRNTNIHFKIKSQLIPSRSFPKSIFKEYINTIITTFGETDFSKQLINMLTGMLGKHKSTHYKLNLNTDIEQVLDYALKQPTKIIVDDIMDDETNPLYLYGTKYERINNETYLPIYIQIIDQSNIKLYEMTKIITSLGHTPIYRKTDCVVFQKNNKKIYPQYNPEKHKWGQFRKVSVPNLNNTVPKEQFKMSNQNWNIHNITNSNQVDDLYNIVKDNSILISGPAGTGKTYLVNSLLTKYLDRSKTLITSFTNRCALNWDDASTLHSSFKITDNGKIGMKLDNFKLFCKKYDYIIIDEISMIPKDIWKIISIVKDNSTTKFILIGDENQTAPIEFFSFQKICYMNQSGVKYIADYNKIILQDVQRYDKNLKVILENLINDIPVDLSLFPHKPEAKINLSFTNKTRVNINKQHNSKQGLFIAKNDNRYSQDMYIYEGCPVIAYKTDKNEKQFVNSEQFTILHYDNEYINLYSERKSEIHLIEIPISIFADNFTLGYCMTAHKSQGTTIKEEFNIYDWDKMDKNLKYTALSRATSIQQVGIVP